MTAPLHESFGIIPVRKRGNGWEVLLIERDKGFWEFPKGHAEKGEAPLEAATRELLEETGLHVVTLLTSKPFYIHYQFPSKDIIYSKRVTYFLAEVEGELKPQPGEVKQCLWVELYQAIEQLTFDNSKQLCQKIISVINHY